MSSKQKECCETCNHVVMDEELSHRLRQAGHEAACCHPTNYNRTEFVSKKSHCERWEQKRKVSHDCTCDNKGWEVRFVGKEQQSRICVACWEKADEARRKEIKASLSNYKSQQAKIYFPSGRMT